MVKIGKVLGVLVATVALGVGSVPVTGQAKSTNKTMTFGQLTNKNTHRLAAIRQATRQEILTTTKAKSSRVCGLSGEIANAYDKNGDVNQEWVTHEPIEE
ncbi:hypothetical protein L3X07_04395 [Levilactobacillus brevis]|nr:hypothetical protein [Levilactobacillus brevis]